MSRYCLDTSAYSQFKRGEPRVCDLIESADWLGIPSVALGEIWLGFHGGRRLRDNAAELRSFLAAPVVEELVVDHEVAKIYAEITTILRRKGRPIPANDIWIAATAARAGATVLTFDEHFNAIERVGTLVLRA